MMSELSNTDFSRYSIRREMFHLQYLPDLAKFILENRLEEFIRITIRYSREARLPLLDSLSQYSEDELMRLNMPNTRAVLTALAENRIADWIEENSRKWVSNTIGTLDKHEIVAEDITLLFFLRRKTFAYFLDAYTKNVVLQKLIMNEVDTYTTQEEIVCYKIYLDINHGDIIKLDEYLRAKNTLFFQTLELARIGCFHMNFKDNKLSYYTPQFMSIVGTDQFLNYDGFLNFICKTYRKTVECAITKAIDEGGPCEVKYTFNVNGQNKRVWMRAMVDAENKLPVMLKGAIRDISKKARSGKRVK